MSDHLTILRAARFDVKWRGGTMGPTVGIPTAALFEFDGVLFTSDNPRNSGEAETINRAVDRLNCKPSAFQQLDRPRT